MTDLRVLIADDEPAGRRNVRVLLGKEAGIEVVAECASGAETVEAILHHEPDLVFLDIQMPGPDGFAVLAQIPSEVMPLIIFVTAFDQYALHAFDVHAADYLLKPFSDERFHGAVARAKERLLQRRAPGASDGAAPRLVTLERIAVRSKHGVSLIPVLEIDWIEARGDYVVIHAGTRAELLRATIGSLESRLDPRRFVRVHRSAIVNLARVREVQLSPVGSPAAVLHSGQRCPLSRRGRERLERVLGQSL